MSVNVPLDRSSVRPLLVAYVVGAVVTIAVGWLIVDVLDGTVFARADLAISEWFADQRGPTTDDLAQFGAGLADTFVVIPVCAVLLPLFWFTWRRLHEWLFVVVALVMEKLVFVSATFVVDRPRPPVGQLDGSPPTASFPSGHVGAAVCLYFGLYLVLRAHARSRLVERLVLFVSTAIVVVVVLSRLELGMHYASDVAWGIVLGVAALAVVGRVVGGPVPAEAAGEATGEDEADAAILPLPPAAGVRLR
jgi:membrane-associated phospholipid phosphatase